MSELEKTTNPVDAAVEVSEGAKVTKMEMIKQLVNEMKDMDKESVQELHVALHGEELDESLTKSELARSIVESLKELDEESVQSILEAKVSEEDEEEKEDEEEMDESQDMENDKDGDGVDDGDEGKDPKKSPEPKPKSVKEESDEDEDDDEDEMEESADAVVDVEDAIDDNEKEADKAEPKKASLPEGFSLDEDLRAITEALELSEDSAEKAGTLFKAAVHSKVESIKEQLQEEQQKQIEISVENIKEDLASGVDKYLAFVAEEWTKENELAIERGLRSEMTENFISGLKELFTEHYVDVPEEKYDVVDELANRLDEMELKLDGEVSKNMELSEELDSLKRKDVVREACADLSESQIEKLESLANGIDFKTEEDFAEKVSEIKEAYFSVSVDETIAEETVVEEGTGLYEESQDSTKHVNPEMQKYLTAISKLQPLG